MTKIDSSRAFGASSETVKDDAQGMLSGLTTNIDCSCHWIHRSLLRGALDRDA